MRLASRFGHVNQIRRDRPLTHEELMHYVPSIFGEDRHTSRSERYAYIPTITVLENLQREGFQPFFACQTRVRDPGRRGYTRHMLRLRRETLFTGTINRTEVHPREVIKRALYHNAAAVVLAHNHPSGEVTPSKADHLITERLVQALALVDIRVPDHLIVGGSQVFSFAEHGLL